MATNQTVRFEQGYLSTNSNTGAIFAGVSMLAAKGSTHISGVCIDPSGNTYVTDAYKHIVIKIAPNGVVTVLAGLSGTFGNNGANTVTCANARFNYPTGICCDRNGDLYVCDTNNHQIRKISGNNVSLVAGAATPASGTTNGVGSAARFNTPYDIAINKSGVIYVADTMNHSIRVIRGGTVSTFAGLSGTSGDAPVWAQMTTAEGIVGTSARFDSPYGIAVDASGYVFVSDTNNNVIKRIDADGRIRIYSGSGTRGTTIGTAKTSEYQDLKFSDCDASGNLFVCDFDEAGASRILKVNREGVPSTVVDFSGEDEGPYLVGIAVNGSSNLVVAQSDYMEIEYSTSSSSSIDSSSSSSEDYSESSSSMSNSSGSSSSSS
jgi:sugar lactone lactonase YvrE